MGRQSSCGAAGRRLTNTTTWVKPLLWRLQGPRLYTSQNGEVVIVNLDGLSFRWSVLDDLTAVNLTQARLHSRGAVNDVHKAFKFVVMKEYVLPSVVHGDKHSFKKIVTIGGRNRHMKLTFSSI